MFGLNPRVRLASWMALWLAACAGSGSGRGSTDGRPDVVVGPEPGLDSSAQDAGDGDRDVTPSEGSLPTDGTIADEASGEIGGDGSVDAAPDTHHEPELIVRVSGGRVEGTLGGTFEGHSFDSRQFLGVPYAAPPVGEGRFAPPEPAEPWTGVRAAKAYGPRCVGVALQSPPEGISEDCLSLNVFTPRSVPKDGLPVMVFLHGGGFATGSSALPGGWLSDRGVVVVTLNYRVGPLGFLAHPALDDVLEVTSGNMGLRDQQLALRWVRDNIAAFGGDPERVALFGQSAGAISTCLHTLLVGSEGLADAFLVESGACVAGTGAPRSRSDAMTAGQSMVDALCPAAADVVQCLRTRPTEDFGSFSTPGLLSASYWPYVDGELLPGAPLRRIRDGELSDAPIVVGSTRNERRFFEAAGSPVTSRGALLLAVHANFPGHADAVLDHYMPATDAEAEAAWHRLWTDEYFRCPARLWAREASLQGRSVYLYSFDVAPAVHSQDLDYVFGWPCCGVSWNYPDEAPIPLVPAIVNAMQGYWTNLAGHGNPNGDALPHWPAYSPEMDAHMAFDAHFSVGTGLSKADCDFWDEIYATEVP